jgi:hypothetical protein
MDSLVRSAAWTDDYDSMTVTTDYRLTTNDYEVRPSKKARSFRLCDGRRSLRSALAPMWRMIVLGGGPVAFVGGIILRTSDPTTRSRFGAAGNH